MDTINEQQFWTDALNWLAIIQGIALCSVVGALLGWWRVRSIGTGACIGALFGPLGWLFLVLVPPDEGNMGRDYTWCGACMNFMPNKATKCGHCGAEKKPPAKAPVPRTRYVIDGN